MIVVLEEAPGRKLAYSPPSRPFQATSLDLESTSLRPKKKQKTPTQFDPNAERTFLRSVHMID